jgi:hypothetical protein
MPPVRTQDMGEFNMKDPLGSLQEILRTLAQIQQELNKAQRAGGPTSADSLRLQDTLANFNAKAAGISSGIISRAGSIINDPAFDPAVKKIVEGMLRSAGNMVGKGYQQQVVRALFSDEGVPQPSQMLLNIKKAQEETNRAQLEKIQQAAIASVTKKDTPPVRSVMTAITQGNRALSMLLGMGGNPSQMLATAATQGLQGLLTEGGMAAGVASAAPLLMDFAAKALQAGPMIQQNRASLQGGISEQGMQYLRDSGTTQESWSGIKDYGVRKELREKISKNKPEMSIASILHTSRIMKVETDQAKARATMAEQGRRYGMPDLSEGERKAIATQALRQYFKGEMGVGTLPWYEQPLVGINLATQALTGEMSTRIREINSDFLNKRLEGREREIEGEFDFLNKQVVTRNNAYQNMMHLRAVEKWQFESKLQWNEY